MCNGTFITGTSVEEEYFCDENQSSSKLLQQFDTKERQTWEFNT